MEAFRYRSATCQGSGHAASYDQSYPVRYWFTQVQSTPIAVAHPTVLLIYVPVLTTRFEKINPSCIPILLGRRHWRVVASSQPATSHLDQSSLVAVRWRHHAFHWLIDWSSSCPGYSRVCQRHQVITISSNLPSNRVISNYPHVVNYRAVFTATVIYCSAHNQFRPSNLYGRLDVELSVIVWYKPWEFELVHVHVMIFYEMWNRVQPDGK